MSIVSGSVDALGAAVDVLIGVSRNREAVLRKVGLPVPSPIALRLLIDTGSYATGLSAAVFPRLGVTRVFQNHVRTTFTSHDKPQLADVFDVSLTLVSGMDQVFLPSILVLCSSDFRLDEPAHGILGRDVLNLCVFQYHGPHRSFQLAFNA